MTIWQTRCSMPDGMRNGMDDKKTQQSDTLDFRESLLEVKQCLGCMHEGLVVTTTDGTIIETSPAAEHILEAPSVVMKGRNIHDYCLSPDVYNDMRRQAVDEVRALNRSLV